MGQIEEVLRDRLVGRRMWLCLAAGDARSFAGHAGYDDDASSRYVSDERVANTRSLREGDFIIVWDKLAAIGVSVIDRIDRSSAAKSLFMCPRCGTTSIKRRVTRSPVYRCQSSCGFEFDQPRVETAIVETYSTFHAPGWIPLNGSLRAAELRRLCYSPASQHSIRAMDPVQTGRRLGQALLQSVRFARTDFGWEGIQGGHRTRTVRARIGQAEFRRALIESFGERCAFVGEVPHQALDAAHLYSYAKVGEHQEHGGLLLRRDLHRLFDEGLIGVRPGDWRLRLTDGVSASESYRPLDGRPVQALLHNKQRFWFREHWAQHELEERTGAHR